MVDVFISYSRSDLAFVDMLARAIVAEGYEVWWDAELPPHKSYGDVITEKIAEARAAIVVWSAEAVKSEWVRAEADMARNQRKLVQTAIDNVVPPLPFNQIQYAEIASWRGEPDHPGWRKVKVSLSELCARPMEANGDRRSAMPAYAPPPASSAVLATPAASKWPLFAGIGIGGVALAAAGLMAFGQKTPPVAEPSGQTSPAAMEDPAPTVPDKTPQPVAVAPPAPAVVQETPVTDEALPDPNPNDQTFPDSSSRLLTGAEVSPLGPSTLKVARNEIFARKGRRFKDPWLRDWFGRFAWYRPRYDEVPLTAIERRNIALIRQAEQRYQ
ncbi:MAG TPA: YARHG domain-containing protein [Novosphingobium sp.]